MLKIAIVGATGLSGTILLNLLEKSSFKITPRLIASKKSIGKVLFFRQTPVKVESLTSFYFHEVDIVFFAAGSKVTKHYAQKALNASCTLIDLSSAFRNDPLIPLVIPEINGHLLNQNPKIISSPNCTTTLMLLALYPIHKLYQLKSIVTSTYQAASGGGYQLLQDLFSETAQYLTYPKLSCRYAFNVYPHPEPSHDPLWGLEEKKMIMETRKILHDPTLSIYPTCIRVPTIRSHSLSIHAAFHKKIDLNECLEALKQAPFLDLHNKNDSFSSQNKYQITCSRLRKVEDNILQMWVTGDQLLKGASLNAFQIFEKLILLKSEENISLSGSDEKVKNSPVVG